MKLKNGKQKLRQKDLQYERKKHIYDFQQYDNIRFFSDNIYTGKININKPEMDQSNLLKNWEEFSEKSKPRTKEGKNKRKKKYL